MKCRDCDRPAYIVDREYDEGYCPQHFDEQQKSTEPVEDWAEIK